MKWEEIAQEYIYIHQVMVKIKKKKEIKTLKIRCGMEYAANGEKCKQCQRYIRKKETCTANKASQLKEKRIMFASLYRYKI